MPKKEKQGVVVSNKMEKTAVVKVASYNQHPKYKKIIESTQKVVSFAKKIKVSLTIKLPFINVTFAPSIFQPSDWRAFVLSTTCVAE